MVFCCILQYFVAKSVFFQFTLFCREISFGTIYALLRGEKFSKKLCPWRKNDKYEVCTCKRSFVAESRNKWHVQKSKFIHSIVADRVALA